MVDRDKVDGLLHHLQRYTGYLAETVRQNRQSFVDDPQAIGSLRYYLQVSIETCISIGNHIIATDRLRPPKDYKDVFRVLAEAGVLTDDLSTTMRELAGLRNILVHLYLEVDDGLLYDEIATQLGDFAAFSGQICTFLKRPAKQ